MCGETSFWAPECAGWSVLGEREDPVQTICRLLPGPRFEAYGTEIDWAGLLEKPQLWVCQPGPVVFARHSLKLCVLMVRLLTVPLVWLSQFLPSLCHCFILTFFGKDRPREAHGHGGLRAEVRPSWSWLFKF